MKQLILFSIFIFLNVFKLEATDTISYPDLRISIGADYRITYARSFKYPQGNGFGLGIHVEKRLIQRMSINSGIYYQEGNVSRFTGIREDYAVADTISRFFSGLNNQNRKEFIIPFQFRFYYVKKPKIYFLLGLEGIFNIRRRNDWEYRHTRYWGKDGVLDERVDTEYQSVSEIPFRSEFGLGAYLGMGIGYKKYNLDIFLKRNPDGLELSFGLKYQIAKRDRKIKEGDVKQGTILDETF